MRIIITTTPNVELVPFNYQQKLIGILHRWIGINELHDDISLYSFSWLTNGSATKDGLNFHKGASWIVSFYDKTVLKGVIESIKSNPDMFCGLRVKEVMLKEESEILGCNRVRFRLGSPILIKRSVNKNTKFYYYNDVESNGLLVETLNSKMAKAGMPIDDSLQISFDLSYVDKKIKAVSIHGIINKCSMCPIIVSGRPETISFLRCVGVGSSTGAGFGFIL